MGKVKTPKYRLEIYEGRKRSSQAWDGRPTLKRLRIYIRRYIMSLQKGGVNYHLSLSLGRIPVPTRAKIVAQKTGKVVVEWTAPAFMAI